MIVTYTVIKHSTQTRHARTRARINDDISPAEGVVKKRGCEQEKTKEKILHKNYLRHNNYVRLSANARPPSISRGVTGARVIISSSILTTHEERRCTKVARANLRIRATKIIARIKSDYFTARHTGVARTPLAVKGGCRREKERPSGRKRESRRREKRDIPLIVSISFAFYLVYPRLFMECAGARQLLISVSPIEITPAFLSA